MKINHLFFCLSLLLISCFGNKSRTAFNPEADEFLKLDSSILSIAVIADSLDVPWDIQYNWYDSSLYFTEIKGSVYRLDMATGIKKRLAIIPDVYQKRTLGLLGMVLHPDFRKYPYAYFSYTIKRDSTLYSKLVRYTCSKDTLTNPLVLMEIEGGTGHNGARLVFSKNGKLLWATGDVHSKTHAQDSTTLNGKILRLEWDGSIPADNPIKGSYVYAWGFRNMQGLTVSDRGYVYTSEHGDAIEDEVNFIEPLRNYGWPVIEGKHDLPAEIAYAKHKNAKEPMYSWTPVIAPAGLAYYGSNQIPEWKNSLLLTTLKGQSLRVLRLETDGKSIIEESVYLENHYGRIRTVTTAPNGDIYIATSNRDWNPQPGFPKSDDDKILKLSRTNQKPSKEPLRAKSFVSIEKKQTGESLYVSYCASCHKSNGEGMNGIFPSLRASEKVIGDKATLIGILKKGVQNTDRSEQMPPFSFLSDEDTALILSYIRTSWGNKADNITMAEVKRY